MAAMTTTAAHRVVVALDVDGVLNACAPSSPRPVHQVVLAPGDLPASPFVSPRDLAGATLELRLDVAADQAFIRELATRAEVVWATTWEDLANKVVAPALGIDPLPLGVCAALDPARFGEARSGDAISWKCRALSRRYAGRHVVLVDDLARGRAPATGVESVSICPDPAVGLTPALRRRVLVAVERLSASAAPRR